MLFKQVYLPQANRISIRKPEQDTILESSNALQNQQNKPMLIPAGRFNADLIIFTLSPSNSEFSQSLPCWSTSDIFTKVPSTL